LETTSRDTVKITIGLIGHPNVGKSSVLNALAGQKLVSVSHTPGHTKRLQSIMLTSDICICDCPGLVFPFAGVPKYLQELSGLYPFSQIREPYSAVRFLASHIELEKVLAVQPLTTTFEGIEEELEWTPWTMCEAYAVKRGYRTDRRGRPDHQRAGAELIRDTVDGIVPFYFFPPDYVETDKLLVTPDLQPVSTASSSSEEDESDENEEPQATAKTAKAAVNAFNLLESSSEEESDSDDE
jgi:ribosome biogenesis GTPase A